MLTNTKQKAFPLKHKETNKGTGEQLRGEVRSDVDANSWLLHPAFLFVLFFSKLLFFSFSGIYTKGSLLVIFQISIFDKTKPEHLDMTIK